MLTAVKADVGRQLCLLGAELAPKARGHRPLVQPLDVDLLVLARHLCTQPSQHAQCVADYQDQVADSCVSWQTVNACSVPA